MQTQQTRVPLKAYKDPTVLNPAPIHMNAIKHEPPDGVLDVDSINNNTIKRKHPMVPNADSIIKK